MAAAPAPARSTHRVLIVGRLDGWQGVHWRQLEGAFRSLGHDCQCFDYASADVPGLVARLLPGDREARLRRRRSEALIRTIREGRPSLVVLHNHRFDMPRLREATNATLVWWDLDGPAGELGTLHLGDAVYVDLVATVSRPILRRLRKHSDTPSFYLPNGVDTDFFAPAATRVAERKRFASQLAFLGRPSPRRIELLAPFSDDDLVVWGSRWPKETRDHQALRACARESGDLLGRDVVALYRCAGLVINILREPFASPPTTLNMQAFQIPSSGACAISEWVEELEESFEPDREIVCFRDAEELAAQIARHSRDRATARQIGEAGRRRCEAHHTLRHRVETLMARVAELT